MVGRAASGGGLPPVPPRATRNQTESIRHFVFPRPFFYDDDVSNNFSDSDSARPYELCKKFEGLTPPEMPLRYWYNCGTKYFHLTSAVRWK